MSTGWQRTAAVTKYTGPHFDRYKVLLQFNDLWSNEDKRAFLLTPRENFVRPEDIDNAYVGHYLDIGFGVTLTPPRHDGPDDQLDHRQAGRQGARNRHRLGLPVGAPQLPDAPTSTPSRSSRPRPPHAQDLRSADRRGLLRVQRHHDASSDDGYYGWAEPAPFDKIIVTCGIDHIPPPLLQQLKPNGLMVIPVGPPGAQHILKVTKRTAADGTVSVDRSDIFGGKSDPLRPADRRPSAEGVRPHDEFRFAPKADSPASGPRLKPELVAGAAFRRYC